MKRFLLVFLSIWTLIGVLTYWLYTARALAALPSFFLETLIFLGMTTCILFAYLYRAKSDHFVQLYLLTMVIKLLGYGGFAVFIILSDRPGAPGNIGFFLGLYIVSMAIELGFLYPKINR